MKVLITGADGFIAKNLRAHLSVRKEIDTLLFTHQNNVLDLVDMVEQADFIFHLAGVNRENCEDEFKTGNHELTSALSEILLGIDKAIPVIYSSSTQAALSNPYGVSKLAAEECLTSLAKRNNSPVYIFRLPNVFGKWARPNYNSAVATFCHNIAHDLPIQINDPAAEVSLVYVDDVVSHFIRIMDGQHQSYDSLYCSVEPVKQISVGELADQIKAFKESRTSLITEPVGTGFIRALYSTYVSYLTPTLFSYSLPKYSDPRGMFVEVLKTKDGGQFSFFTAPPGITRGGHYHHSKTEKFIVMKGKARFCFRHIMLGDYHEIVTNGDEPTIVETVPGWAHDITNVGEEDMIVMLWANEIFDKEHPDTYASAV